jgi:hypothetical protein
MGAFASFDSPDPFFIQGESTKNASGSPTQNHPLIIKLTLRSFE